MNSRWVGVEASSTPGVAKEKQCKFSSLDEVAFMHDFAQHSMIRTGCMIEAEPSPKDVYIVLASSSLACHCSDRSQTCPCERGRKSLPACYHQLSYEMSARRSEFDAVSRFGIYMYISAWYGKGVDDQDPDHNHGVN